MALNVPLLSKFEGVIVWKQVPGFFERARHFNPVSNSDLLSRQIRRNIPHGTQHVVVFLADRRDSYLNALRKRGSPLLKNLDLG
jgi:hypothetical protein